MPGPFDTLDNFTFGEFDFTEIFPFFDYWWVRAIIILLKILLGGLGLFFLFFTIYIAWKYGWFEIAIGQDASEFFRAHPYGLGSRNREWKNIKDRLLKADEGEYKLAILEADQILEKTLIRLAVPGATIEEKLQSTTSAIIPGLEVIRQAHEVRNNIIRDPSYFLRQEDAERVLLMYEETFRALDLVT